MSETTAPNTGWEWFRGGTDPNDPLVRAAREASPRIIGGLALGGLALGAAARGGIGLADIVRRQAMPLKVTHPAPIVTRVPVPVEEEEGDEKRARDPYPWWHEPAALAASAGGAFAGWKLLDGALDAQRRKQNDATLERAKREFEDTLLASYETPQEGPAQLETSYKAGAAQTPGAELSRRLDELYDAVTAEGGLTKTGSLLSKYLAFWALPAAASGAYLGWHKAQGASRRGALESAMYDRARARYAASPSEIYVVPKPVPPRVREEDEPAEAAEETYSATRTQIPQDLPRQLESPDVGDTNARLY